MGFLQKLFGGSKLDGDKLARSADKSDFAQVDLLSQFVEPRLLHDPLTQQRWNRILPRSYPETIDLFVEQGWLISTDDLFQTAASAMPFVEHYQARLARARAEVMPKVRKALEARDTGEALEIRRAYEARHALGSADWTGPEPQLSLSALTRRILYLDHWLLDGLSPESVDWLKLAAAERHLWGVYWPLEASEVPEIVQRELATDEIDGVEAAYWRAYQLALYVDNQETWQRCKGGDHVRRIEIGGADDEFTCDHCRQFLGEEYLVVRVPELPHRECASPRGCRCRFDPVLESYEDLAR